jgi:hypothetical protein
MYFISGPKLFVLSIFQRSFVFFVSAIIEYSVMVQKIVNFIKPIGFFLIFNYKKERYDLGKGQCKATKTDSDEHQMVALEIVILMNAELKQNALC